MLFICITGWRTECQFGAILKKPGDQWRASPSGHVSKNVELAKRAPTYVDPVSTGRDTQCCPAWIDTKESL